METQFVVLDPVGLEKKCTVTFQAPDVLRAEALAACRYLDISMSHVLRNALRGVVAQAGGVKQKKR